MTAQEPIGRMGTPDEIAAITAAHVNVLSREGATPTAALSGGLQWALWVCSRSHSSRSR
jgi:hypothetical protein